MTAQEFLEREAGNPYPYLRALTISDLQSAAEAAAEEFKYDKGQEQFVALCRRLAEWEPMDFSGAGGGDQ